MKNDLFKLNQSSLRDYKKNCYKPVSFCFVTTLAVFSCHFSYNDTYKILIIDADTLTIN